jgi:hypothetical protein
MLMFFNYLKLLLQPTETPRSPPPPQIISKLPLTPIHNDAR